MLMPIASSIPPAGSHPYPATLLCGALGVAAAACHQVLIDYRSGLLDEQEITRALVRSGVVIAADQVWLLDTNTGQWWRYVGGEPTLAAIAGCTDVPTTSSLLDEDQP